MKKYLIRVDERTVHAYEIEAEDEDSALEIYYSYNNSQLKDLDIDGQPEWDSPMYVVEV